MGHGEGFATLVEGLRKSVKECSVDQIMDKFNAHEKFFFVDVREDSEWNIDHLKGAIHLGKGIIERDIESTIPDKNSDIVLYCGGGFRSVIAATNLLKMGYTNVSSMKGGYKEWKKKSFPIQNN